MKHLIEEICGDDFNLETLRYQIFGQIKTLAETIQHAEYNQDMADLKFGLDLTLHDKILEFDEVLEILIEKKELVNRQNKNPEIEKKIDCGVRQLNLKTE